jgi:hypothetical protein
MQTDVTSLDKAVAAQNLLAEQVPAAETNGALVRILVEGVYNDVQNKRIPGTVRAGTLLLVQGGYAATLIADGLAELPADVASVEIAASVSEESTNREDLPVLRPRRRSGKA